MNRRLLFPLVLSIILVFFLSSSIAEDLFVFNTIHYRDKEGIYIDTIASPVLVKGQQLRFRWGYDQENVSVPYKFAKMPFWIEHDLPFVVDLCDGRTSFKTTYPTSTYINWDYNVLLPNYKNKIIAEPCFLLFDGKSCYIGVFDGSELVFCDGGLEKNICWHTVRVEDGTITITRSHFVALSDLPSCPLQRNKRYNLYHYGEIPLGKQTVFDVSLELNLPTADKATFVIPAPSWTSTTANDYNSGNAWDFNWTKVTWDGNIMPVGDDRIHNDNNQLFYDANLVAYWKFNDKNSTGNGIRDDTNKANNGQLINGADINAWGLWDTNAGYFDGVNDYVNAGNGASLDIRSAGTVSAWFKGTAEKDYAIIAGSYSILNDRNGYLLAVFGNHLWSELGNASTHQATAGATGILFDGRWYHGVVTWDGITVKLYLNGKQDRSEAQTVIPVSNVYNFKIGHSDYSLDYFNGSLEELKIYNRALSAAEIQADYNSWMHSNYLSPVKDAGAAANWDAMDWNAFVDVNNNVTVDYRGCSAADCSTAGEWQTNLRGSPPGTWWTDIRADNNRYFQYRVNFDTNKQQWNPVRTSNSDKGAFGQFSNVVVVYSVISGEDSCSCPASGHWNIVNNDVCTLSTICNLSAGSLHVFNGSLTVTSSGILSIPTGYKIIIEKTVGKLVVEKGGKVVINK